MEFDKNMYGDTPESFRLLVRAAVKVDVRPLVRKRRYAVVLACVLALLMATTALAITHSLGIFDALFHMNTHNAIDPATIDTEVVQSGGAMQHVTYTAREAMFDGRIARVAIAQTPTAENTTVLHFSELNAYPSLSDEPPPLEYLADSQARIDDATQYGEQIVAVDLWLEEMTDAGGQPVDLQYGYWSGNLREEGSVVDVFGFVLPPEVDTDALTLRFTITTGLPDGEGGYEIYTERGELVLEIARTGEATVLTVPADLTYGNVHIREVELRYMAYEMALCVYGELTDVDTDPWDLACFYDETGRPLYFEMSSANDACREQGLHAISIIEATDDVPAVLYAQYDGAETALKIHLEEGYVTEAPALDETLIYARWAEEN